MANPRASSMSSIWGTDRIIWISTALSNSTVPAQLFTAHMISFLSQLNSVSTAFLSRCHMILASPTLWGLHCNLGFMFPASCSELLMGNLTHIAWPQSFRNLCASLYGPLYFCYFMLAKPVPCGQCFQVLPVWNCSLAFVVGSVCLWCDADPGETLP